MLKSIYLTESTFSTKTGGAMLPEDMGHILDFESDKWTSPAKNGVGSLSYLNNYIKAFSVFQ